MAANLLTTKLFQPRPRPELISRSRLAALLNQGLARKLTLISASAGYGKTTLLSDWIHGGEGSQLKTRVAWVSLDEGDNDPARFLAYLTTALQGVEPGFGETLLAMLTATQPPQPQVILTGLLNDLAGIQQMTILVLDDYHWITAQPIHELLDFLLENLPPQIHLVIASRMDPPLRLARLRGRGEMVEIRTADLRFTSEEARDFLKQMTGIELSVSDLSALSSRTEGWITGLQLAGLSLRGRDDPASFIRAFTGSHRYVLDYLTEEVLELLDPRERDFLLHTALLEQFNAALCQTITGISGCQAILERFEEANLFIVPLDEHRGWYRYHYLFADLLRQRVQREMPDAVVALHRGAANWYQAHGWPDSAIHHALGASDYRLAAEIVEKNALALLKSGGTTRLLAWIDSVPREEAGKHPWLGVYQAWGLVLSGRMTEIEPALARVQVAGLLEGETDIFGHIAAIRSYGAAMQGDVGAAIELAHEALDRLDPENLTVRSVVAFVLGGMQLFADDMAGAALRLAEASEMGLRDGNIHLGVSALSALGDLQVVQGRLGHAERTYQRALDYAESESGGVAAFAGGVLSGLGEVHFLRNRPLEARALLEEGVGLCRVWGNPEALISALVGLAHLEVVEKNIPGVVAMLEEVQHWMQARPGSPGMDGLIASCQVRVWAAQRDLDAIRQWVEKGGEEGVLPGFFGEPGQLARARGLITLGKPEAALEILEGLIPVANTGGRIARVIEMRVLEGLAHHGLEDRDRAVEALEEALVLASSEEILSPFLDEAVGEWIRLERSRLEGKFADRLLMVLDLPTAVALVEAVLVEPLSERELEVLTLIAAGLSNRGVAERLFITVGTVKAHTASIYGKLGVHRRTQAVARAREMGLIK